MGRAFGPGAVASPSGGGGRIQWGGPPVAPAGPSAADQKLLRSFSQIDPGRRKVTLESLVARSQKGDKEAARKVQLLAPLVNGPAPKTPDYTDKSLSGRAYQASKFIQSQIPALVGTGTAGEEVERDKSSKVTGFKRSGAAETVTDTAIRGVQARLNFAGGAAAVGAKPPLAVLKAGAGAGAANAAANAAGELNSKQRAGKSPRELATSIAKSAATGAATGAVLGGGGKALELALLKAVPKLNVRPEVAHEFVSAKKLKNYEKEAPERSTVLAYKNAIQDGRPIEPLKVTPDGKGKLAVEDGKHRLQAMKELGIKEIPIEPTTLPVGPSRAKGELARELAVGANERGDIGSPAKVLDDTPAAKEFRSKIISGVPKQAKGASVKAAVGKAKSELIDKFSPIKTLSKEYEQLTGKPLDIESDPYKLARLHAGTSDLQKAKIEELGALIREAPDVDALKEVGVATRILTDRSGIKNPISPEVAQQRLDELKAKLGPEQFAKTQEVVKKVVAYHDQTLKYLADNGIISKAAYDSIKKNNQNYFAKFDVVDYLTDNQAGIRKGSSFNVARQDLIKSQKGTTKAIADPIEATIRQTAKAIDLVERNKVGQAVLKMADKSDGLVTSLKGDSVPAGYERFSTFVDGKKVDLAVSKDIADSLKQLNRKQADVVTHSLSFLGNLFRKSATTFNLGFAAITNPIRDAQTFALNSKYVPIIKVPFALMGGFAQGIKKGDLYREFLANKGGQSTFFSRGSEAVTETAKAISRTQGEKFGRTILNPKELFGIIPAVERIGETFELAPRLAEFKAAKKAGASPLQAAFDARNVTVDFAQSGSTGQILNKWVPFLNARLQGNLKNIEAIGRNPLRAGAVGATTIVLPVIATYAHNRANFNDEYDSIPPYVKENYFVIIYGKERDADGNLKQVVKIPKSDMGRVFGNPTEQFMEYLYKKDPKNIVDVLIESGSALSPVDFARDGKIDPGLALGGFIPPAAKGVIENAANYSFFRGAPVVSGSKAKLPAKEQVYDSTSALAKAIGNATNTSPIKNDNLIRSLTAGATKQFTDPVGSLTSRVSGAAGNNAETQYYKHLDKLTPEKNSVNNKINAAIAKGDVDEAKRLASGWNKRMDTDRVEFDKQYGKLLNDDQREGLDDLKFNLTPASIKQRQKRLKDK